MKSSCGPMNPAAWCLLAAAMLTGASCRKVEPTRAAPPKIITTEHGIEMVLIPAGRFKMGSRRGEADEAPAHEVAVDAFLIDRYEVTQEVYLKFVLDTGSRFKGDQLPRETVHWHFAASYCNERSRAEGLEPCYDEDTAACNFEADGYRLPTEAEWEYACRAGSEGEHSFGSDSRLLKQHAWFAGNAGKKTHPVGIKKPNAWGLYDMHGNVAEWCSDPYDKDYYKSSPAKNPRGPADGEKYVLRGGSFLSSEKACRAAARAAENPGFTDACFPSETIGFRCARKAPKQLRASGNTVGQGLP